MPGKLLKTNNLDLEEIFPELRTMSGCEDQVKSSRLFAPQGSPKSGSSAFLVKGQVQNERRLYQQS
jgi:hypothetical protein